MWSRKAGRWSRCCIWTFVWKWQLPVILCRLHHSYPFWSLYIYIIHGRHVVLGKPLSRSRFLGRSDHWQETIRWPRPLCRPTWILTICWYSRVVFLWRRRVVFPSKIYSDENHGASKVVTMARSFFTFRRLYFYLFIGTSSFHVHKICFSI